MSGSGNDFVFFDARTGTRGELRAAGEIQRLCDRRQGVGADGVVFLESGTGPSSFRMAYYNSDGSRATMCGNAALCSTRLSTELGAASPAGFVFDSDAGPVHARIRDGLPEVDLSPVTTLSADAAGIAPGAGEQRIGFAVAGVPHVVVLCTDVHAVPLDERGRSLRRHASLGEAGANANFVSPAPGGGWLMRTFERGVEAETLACGTGAVASAAVLRAWALGGADGTELTTRSGRVLGVRLRATPDGALQPSLRGEGRSVFAGELGEL
jgi:diaminopimelate epimerase